MQKYRYNMSGDSFAEEKRNKQIIRAAVRKCEKQIGENTGRNINGDVKALLEDPQYGFVIKKENSSPSTQINMPVARALKKPVEAISDAS